MLRICRPKLFDPQLLSRVVWAQSSASWGSDVLCWHIVLQSWGDTCCVGKLFWKVGCDVLCGHNVLKSGGCGLCVSTKCFAKWDLLRVVWEQCSGV